ncbi:MAG: class I SAM-dependent methyltransferase [Treponema sp.]|nr:class I SAM-dependent methyltransferase [Treponema sp.]
MNKPAGKSKKTKSVKTWSTPQRKEERIPVPCVLCRNEKFVPHFDHNGSNPLFNPGNDLELVFFSYVRCIRCGLVQINPQPSPEAVALRYDKNHGNDYLDYEIANEKAFLRLQELALKDAGFYILEQKILHAHAKAGVSAAIGNEVPEVLDIGCATGALLSTLKNKGWKVRGVEISGPQATYCRKQGLDVSNLPLEENHFPGQTFDVVLASHVIEHLNNPFAFAEEVKRILKPRGCFFITTPNIAGLQSRIFGSGWRSVIFDHLYLFSKRNLRKLLIKAGFTVERVKTWGGLAAGSAPSLLKSIFDKLAKPLGFGDVMIVRAISK